MYITNEEKLNKIRNVVSKCCEGFIGQKISSELDLKIIACEIRYVILSFWPECPELFAVNLTPNDIVITDKYEKPLDHLLLEEFILGK